VKTSPKMQIYAASYLLPINGPPVEGGAVAVEKGLIKAVGNLNELRKKFTAPVHEYPGAVLLPGLVNAHTHLELTHFPDWLFTKGFDVKYCPYVDWIIRVIKVKRQVGLEDLSVSLLQGLRMAIQSGTTMVGDILSDRRLIHHYNNSPLSGRIYLEFLGQDKSRYSTLLDAMDDDLGSIQQNFLAGVAPHSPFTVSQSLLKSLLSAAHMRNLPITMHLAESEDESQFFTDATGKISEKLYPFVGWEEYLPDEMRTTPTAWLDLSGALSPDFLAVHGVHLSVGDINLLKKNKVSVVLAPRSNHNLDVGQAPVKGFLNAGIPLALGTDSLASNDSLSLWDEMKFLLDAFPQSFSPVDAIKMATIGGAKALKRDFEAGTLEPGKRADFIVMETGNISAAGKVCEQLLEGSKLHGVWCGGEKICSFDNYS